ncbi:MAG: hypothetical protein ACQESR_17655, partial [Planctomycetota bacterium]
PAPLIGQSPRAITPDDQTGGMNGGTSPLPPLVPRGIVCPRFMVYCDHAKKYSLLKSYRTRPRTHGKGGPPTQVPRRVAGASRGTMLPHFHSALLSILRAGTALLGPDAVLPAVGRGTSVARWFPGAMAAKMACALVDGVNPVQARCV